MKQAKDRERERAIDRDRGGIAIVRERERHSSICTNNSWVGVGKHLEPDLSTFYYNKQEKERETGSERTDREASFHMYQQLPGAGVGKHLEPDLSTFTTIRNQKTNNRRRGEQKNLGK